MLGKRIAIGTAIATAVAGVAIAAPGGAAHSLDRHQDRARSARATLPAWRVALELRSDALNRRYGLGQYALSPSSVRANADWQRALLLRSDALNRKYGLGAYAKAGP